MTEEMDNGQEATTACSSTDPDDKTAFLQTAILTLSKHRVTISKQNKFSFA